MFQGGLFTILLPTPLLPSPPPPPTSRKLSFSGSKSAAYRGQLKVTLAVAYGGDIEGRSLCRMQMWLYDARYLNAYEDSLYISVFSRRGCSQTGHWLHRRLNGPSEFDVQLPGINSLGSSTG